jgi:hypothetical protein
MYWQVILMQVSIDIYLITLCFLCTGWRDSRGFQHAVIHSKPNFLYTKVKLPVFVIHVLRSFAATRRSDHWVDKLFYSVVASYHLQIL